MCVVQSLQAATNVKRKIRPAWARRSILRVAEPNRTSPCSRNLSRKPQSDSLTTCTLLKPLNSITPPYGIVAARQCQRSAMAGVGGCKQLHAARRDRALVDPVQELVLREKRCIAKCNGKSSLCKISFRLCLAESWALDRESALTMTRPRGPSL